MLNEIKQDLKKMADPKKAAVLRRFFKTGKGEYGEGDEFIGVKMPDQRKIAKRYQDEDLNTVQKLLDSKTHEYRMTGLLILINQYERARRHQDEEEMKGLVNFYLANLKHVNNWDLVDLSAPKILGDYLWLRKSSQAKTKNIDIDLLYNLAKSKNLWKRRIAILSTFALIKQGEFDDALNISRRLLRDKQDLIHKAVGWMLREIGKQDEKTLFKFLDKYHQRMPRTMLRYAIERLNVTERERYLGNKVKSKRSNP